MSVEGDIETAKFFDSFRDERLNVGGFGDIGLDEEAVAAGGADERDGFVAFDFAAAGDDYLRSVFCEEDGSVASDAGGAAGDQGDFILEFSGHCLFLLVSASDLPPASTGQREFNTENTRSQRRKNGRAKKEQRRKSAATC